MTNSYFHRLPETASSQELHTCPACGRVEMHLLNKKGEAMCMDVIYTPKGAPPCYHCSEGFGDPDAK